MAWAGAVGSGVAAAARLIDAGIDKATVAGRKRSDECLLASDHNNKGRRMTGFLDSTRHCPAPTP